MRIFVSWSGEASREAAELMKQWLPNVIQEADVWVSSQDIGKGENWSASLWSSLTEIEFGILMVTRENCTAPWIMFEAGVLSKSVKARVIPVLCETERLDIANTPLSQFQNARVTNDDIWQVLVAINSACARPLDEARLKNTFDKWWPDFESSFKKIKFTDPAAALKSTGAKADSTRLDKIENALEGIMSSLQRSITRDRPTPPMPNPYVKVVTKDGQRFFLDKNGGLHRFQPPSLPIESFSENDGDPNPIQ
jgi:hypothetical protein